MKKELVNFLYKKYPEIFAEAKPLTSQTAVFWGFSCGDGWFQLINKLCAVLQHSVNQPHSLGIQPVALQVKEKFGELRFYTAGNSDFQAGAIDYAEELSVRICELCGKRGSLVVSHRGWWKTRCADHVEEGDITPDEYAEGIGIEFDEKFLVREPRSEE